MSFDNNSIEFLIEHLKSEINFYEGLDGTGDLFKSLPEKNTAIIKRKLILTMLLELESISNNRADLRLSAASSCLVFSCISDETLKGIGFKLFLLKKFGAQDMLKSDWDSVRESIYEDIRKNLPKRIDGLGYEHFLEEYRKDLAELNEESEKLQTEYKTYWLGNKKMEEKINTAKEKVSEVSKRIIALEGKILSNRALLNVVNLGEECLFDGLGGEGQAGGLRADERSDGPDKSSLRVYGTETYSFDLIKIFCQLISGNLISRYEDEALYSDSGDEKGEYSIQYDLMLNNMHKEMLKRVDKVVGYRLADDIDDGDKNYPHVSKALIEVFIDSLDSEEGAAGKRYFIRYGDDRRYDQRLELDLELIDEARMFRDQLTLGCYNSVTHSNILDLGNENIIESIKRKLAENEVLVNEILENFIKEINIDFLNAERVASSGRFLSHEYEIYNAEYELRINLNLVWIGHGFVVSDKYCSNFIFKKKFQNLINAHLKMVDTCISYYLDTGLALPLIEILYPLNPQVMNKEVTEGDAKKLIEDIFKNSGDKKLNGLIASAVTTHALIKAKEKIAKISPEDEAIFGVSREQWVNNLADHLFFGDEITLPYLVTMHIDVQAQEKLKEEFTKNLRSVYKNKINKRKQDLVEGLANKLRIIPDKSIGSVEEWKERIGEVIIETCPLGKSPGGFKEKFSSFLAEKVFSNYKRIFIEKFDISKAFIEPSYPIDFNQIAASSKKVVDRILQDLGIHKNSLEYDRRHAELMTLYNQVLFEWECGEIKKLLKLSVKELDDIVNNLTVKSTVKEHFKSALDFILQGAGGAIKAAIAVFGSGLLLGMTPQAVLCLILLKIMVNANPIIGIALFILCYKYVLPRLLNERAKAALEKYEDAVLSAFNMAILPIVEFINHVPSLLRLKLPQDREKTVKMLISFVSVLVGAVAFIYCPAMIPVILVTGAVNISPLIFAYVATAFTFFVSSQCLGVSYDTAFEEKLKTMLSRSLKLENFEATQLEFLKIFKELGKDNHFLKEFKDFLSKIVNKPKGTQAKAIINFLEARTLDLLADLSLSDFDERLSSVNGIIEHLKNLSKTILRNADDSEKSKNNQDSGHIDQLKTKIQILVEDAPRRRLKP